MFNLAADKKEAQQRKHPVPLITNLLNELVLVKAGVKDDFATKVVEKSGHSPNEIIKNPAKVLGEYWYDNVNVDFLADAIALNGLHSLSLFCERVDSEAEIASELRKGLTALELQTSVVDKACSTPPRSELLGHRDIFGWGLVVVQGRLAVSVCVERFIPIATTTPQ